MTTKTETLSREINESIASMTRVQEATFTAWCQRINPQIKNLTVDLSDGITLVKLVDSLSDGRFVSTYGRRISTKPNSTAAKMENIQRVLSFMTEVEGIKIVNISAEDIFNGDKKLTLALVWNLILRYHISSLSPSSSQSQSQSSSSTTGGGGTTDRKSVV